jgi:hypothetical protein
MAGFILSSEGTKEGLARKIRQGKIPDILERRHQWRARRRYYKAKGEERRMEVGFVLGRYHLGNDFSFFFVHIFFLPIHRRRDS